MKKRKLLIGLSSAGVLLAGFGGTVLPAAADRVFEVQFPSGQVVRVTVPDGKTLAEVVPGAIVSATEVGPASAARAGTRADAHAALRRPRPRPRPPSRRTPAPTPQDGQGNAAKPTEVPQGGRVEQQSAQAADRARAKARAAARRKAAAEAKAKAKAEKAKADAQAKADAAGAPLPTDPTFSLALPGAAAIGVPNFFIDKFRIPPFLLPIYQAAGIQYGVRWEVLAAINEIETDYGRNLNVSTAGAVGWMQFLPSTWEMYGVDANDDGRKDPYNPVDAIFAAARYLKAAGADQDVRRAIFAYNHADWYVESVLLRARLIGGLPSDLVGSLTGLTQGHFPVYAKASYADDLTKQDAQRKVAAGRNAAVPVESTSTRRGIRIFAKAGAPVVATQDGRIVRVGTSPRLGRFVAAARRLRQHVHLRAAQVARARLPGPARAQGHRHGRPARAQAAGRRPQAHRARLGGPAARRPGAPGRRDGQVPPRRQRHDDRRAGGQGAGLREPEPPGRLQGRRPGPAHAERRRPRQQVVPQLLHAGLRAQALRRPPQAPQGRVEGHRRDDPGPHRPHRRPPSPRTCCSRSGPPAAAPRGSTRSRSSTAGSSWSPPRSTARPARTPSSAPTRATRPSGRS